MTIRFPLEAHTRNKINTRLQNLGWILDQNNPLCNVFQEQAKTEMQNTRLMGNKPDYILYESGTDIPIAVIEAKKPGEYLDKGMNQAIEKYAKPLQIPLVFVFNETFVLARHTLQSRPLKIDGEELQDFVDQFTSLRFINEGAEILSTPKGINFTRDELMDTFKSVNNLLRKEGLRDGYERFSAFSEILFLKLIDEYETLTDHVKGIRRLEDRFLWKNFINKYYNDNQALLDFISDSVWKKLRELYGSIFISPFTIKKATTLRYIIDLIDPINLTSTDTDIKGDAFEYFLKTVTNGNKDLGEYFTPRHIVRSMVNIIKPQYGETIYDPFCGTGGFLLESFKYLSSRADTTNNEILEWIRKKALHGRELTSTTRVAKMNMILFGDGHSNIEQMDSLEKPVKEKYNIVLSNIPYSQETEYGSFYSIPTKNADAICMQHIYESLKPNGRAAVVVPESFLYEDGAIGKTREMIAKNTQKFSVISLPRGVFMPYTPTKTNIIYFQKGGQFKKAYFFIVNNDGFELNTGRKPIEGYSDIKKLLSEIDEPTQIQGQANTVDREIIKQSGNWNLRPFYYMEDIPQVKGELIQLNDNLIEEITDRIDPLKNSDLEYKIIEVSQNGIFLGDIMRGHEATQKYKPVKIGDIVYNPYRINIGSIGVVPPHLDGAFASPAYVVVRCKNANYSPFYIVSILKQPRFLKVIMNYSLSSARASLPFSELIRIKIPKLNDKDIKEVKNLEKGLIKQLQESSDNFEKINRIVSKLL
ncbi:MAG: N-6 DNA methylase [Rickettsia endosymbiont of Culicoides impunctatus]|uniref:N-6 DNA methylase n=1 Tax=unclassified Candidatus Tisiphia TaxID=2996318 RepID=UPI001E7F0F13|nr:MAG: N-6 DNA methylase [Rickettsia endosymbiont of Culicoides impunctatus]